MNSSQIPAFLTMLWAANAGAAYKRVIPQGSQIGITPGRASFNDGFPPLNFDAVDAGGTPPSGADHNGILAEITQIEQWGQAGAGVPFNQAFSTAIGGYPKGARLHSTRAGFPVIWQSLVENNNVNPDTAALGNTWIADGVNTIVTSGALTLTAQHHCTLVIASNNGYVITLPPAATAIGLSYDFFCINTGGAITVQSAGGNISGYGTGVASVSLNTACEHYSVVSDGAGWWMTAYATFNSANTFAPRGNVIIGGTLEVDGTATFGASTRGRVEIVSDAVQPGHVRFYLPNGTYVGYIGATDGSNNLELVAQAPYSGWTAVGNLFVSATLDANEVVSTTLIQGQYARLTDGAYNTGDANRVAFLGDWVRSYGVVGQGYTRGVDGTYDITMTDAAPYNPNGTTVTTITFNTAFPNNCLEVIGSFAGTAPEANLSIAFQIVSRTQFQVSVNQSQNWGGTAGFQIRARGN